MKKYLALLLAVLLTLCTGCGAPVPEAQASQKAGYDLYEGTDRADDSMTFRWYWEAGKKELTRYIQEDVLPEYVDTWFEDGEILDAEVYDTLNEVHRGWVLISGSPRKDMGWKSMERDGKTVYCRRLLIRHLPHSQNYRLEKTMASPDLRAPEPVKALDPQVLGIEEAGLQLPEIRSAELYVDSLESAFVLKDREKLKVLRKALTLPACVRMKTFQAGQVKDDGTGNALVLDLEGQGRRMIYTDAKGGPACSIWDGHLLLMPMSIFDLFEVPLEPEGYSFDQKGNTLLTVQARIPHVDVMLDYLAALDPRGNLIRFEDRTRYSDMDPDQPGSVAEYTYNEEDLTTGSVEGRPDHQEKQDLVYNDRGLLIRKTVSHGKDDSQTTVYEYDDQDRLIAKIGLLPSGEEDQNYSRFFWYDEKGSVHSFWYQLNGTPSGDPPEAPVRRPKK